MNDLFYNNNYYYLTLPILTTTVQEDFLTMQQVKNLEV